MIDSFIRRISRSKLGEFVGLPDNPIMTRFYVIPKNPVFNIYLHHIHRSDEGDLHDHRAANISVILKGCYCEQMFSSRPIEGRAYPRLRVKVVDRLQPRFRWAGTPHRLILLHGEVWSLWFKFPHTQNWSFYKKDVFGTLKRVPHDA